MKSKLGNVFTAILFGIGLLAIAAFVIIVLGGENATRWIPALVPAIIFVISGFIKAFGNKMNK